MIRELNYPLYFYTRRVRATIGIFLHTILSVSFHSFVWNLSRLSVFPAVLSRSVDPPFSVPDLAWAFSSFLPLKDGIGTEELVRLRISMQ